MVIGLLRLDLFLPDTHSLKQKRSLIRPVMERIRREWNVSVTEVDHQDSWQRTTLAVANVNTETAEAERTLGHIARSIEGNPDIQLLDFSVEIR
jgi:uncharacterized protein YlxP (DUF503 family)